MKFSWQQSQLFISMHAFVYVALDCWQDRKEKKRRVQLIVDLSACFSLTCISPYAITFSGSNKLIYTIFLEFNPILYYLH